MIKYRILLPILFMYSSQMSAPYEPYFDVTIPEEIGQIDYDSEQFADIYVNPNDTCDLVIDIQQPQAALHITMRELHGNTVISIIGRLKEVFHQLIVTLIKRAHSS